MNPLMHTFTFFRAVDCNHKPHPLDIRELPLFYNGFIDVSLVRVWFWHQWHSARKFRLSIYPMSYIYMNLVACSHICSRNVRVISWKKPSQRQNSRISGWRLQSCWQIRWATKNEKYVIHKYVMQSIHISYLLYIYMYIIHLLECNRCGNIRKPLSRLKM